MSLTVKYQERGVPRANKVFVETSYSSDGRSLESFWLDYNPEERYALFLLQFALDSSEGVVRYAVYDANGMRMPNPSMEKHPKMASS